MFTKGNLLIVFIVLGTWQTCQTYPDGQDRSHAEDLTLAQFENSEQNSQDDLQRSARNVCPCKQSKEIPVRVVSSKNTESYCPCSKSQNHEIEISNSCKENQGIDDFLTFGITFEDFLSEIYQLSQLIPIALDNLKKDVSIECTPNEPLIKRVEGTCNNYAEVEKKVFNLFDYLYDYLQIPMPKVKVTEAPNKGITDFLSNIKSKGLECLGTLRQWLSFDKSASGIFHETLANMERVIYSFPVKDFECLDSLTIRTHSPIVPSTSKSNIHSSICNFGKDILKHKVESIQRLISTMTEFPTMITELIEAVKLALSGKGRKEQSCLATIQTPIMKAIRDPKYKTFIPIHKVLPKSTIVTSRNILPKYSRNFPVWQNNPSPRHGDSVSFGQEYLEYIPSMAQSHSPRAFSEFLQSRGSLCPPEFSGYDDSNYPLMIERRMKPSSRSKSDSLTVRFTLLQRMVSNIFKTSGIMIGDTIIMNLTEDICLVGIVDSDDQVTFNLIQRDISRSSRNNGRKIWNLSSKDFSINNEIFEYILNNLECIK